MPIITPPFRTSLLTQNGVPFGTGNGDIQTTRDWWLYWQQLTDQGNANSKLATAGTHGDRPMPVSMPEGALYYENDRGVLYANTLGVWQYVAGTMYGTLSPDQRPTGLGTHDAGFDFRTTTSPPREFIWNQTAWVEITPVGGALNLTHPNVVVKVDTTSGQIVEGGITDLSAANSDKMHITAAGLIGIGTAAAPSNLSVLASANVNPSLLYRSGGIVSFDQGGGELAFGLSNTPNFPFWLQARIFNNTACPLSLNPSGGNIGIGTQAPGYQLTLSSDSAGKPATSTWTVISDLQLKQNIEPVKDDSLAILGKLNWVRYEYNGKAETPRGLKAIGLVAQALEKQLPEAVRSTRTKLNETDADETDVLAIDYHHIIVHSARAIQQLDAELKALKVLLGKAQP